MDKDKLIADVQKFKQAIIESELQQLGHDYRKFKYFPQACCVLTSHLLSRFLIRNYPYLELKVVNGEATHAGSIWHYWVESNGIVVDITMSQIRIELPDVIWAKSAWHNKCRILETWEVTPQFEDVAEGADSANSNALERGLELIISKVKFIDSNT